MKRILWWFLLGTLCLTTGNSKPTDFYLRETAPTLQPDVRETKEPIEPVNIPEGTTIHGAQVLHNDQNASSGHKEVPGVTRDHDKRMTDLKIQPMIDGDEETDETLMPIQEPDVRVTNSDVKEKENSMLVYNDHLTSIENIFKSTFSYEETPQSNLNVEDIADIFNTSQENEETEKIIEMEGSGFSVVNEKTARELSGKTEETWEMEGSGGYGKYEENENNPEEDDHLIIQDPISSIDKTILPTENYISTQISTKVEDDSIIIAVAENNRILTEDKVNNLKMNFSLEESEDTTVKIEGGNREDPKSSNEDVSTENINTGIFKEDSAYTENSTILNNEDEFSKDTIDNVNGTRDGRKLILLLGETRDLTREIEENTRKILESSEEIGGDSNKINGNEENVREMHEKATFEKKVFNDSKDETSAIEVTEKVNVENEEISKSVEEIAKSFDNDVQGFINRKNSDGINAKKTSKDSLGKSIKDNEDIPGGEEIPIEEIPAKEISTEKIIVINISNDTNTNSEFFNITKQKEDFALEIENINEENSGYKDNFLSTQENAILHSKKYNNTNKNENISDKDEANKGEISKFEKNSKRIEENVDVEENTLKYSTIEENLEIVTKSNFLTEDNDDELYKSEENTEESIKFENNSKDVEENVIIEENTFKNLVTTEENFEMSTKLNFIAEENERTQTNEESSESSGLVSKEIDDNIGVEENTLKNTDTIEENLEISTKPVFLVEENEDLVEENSDESTKFENNSKEVEKIVNTEENTFKNSNNPEENFEMSTKLNFINEENEGAPNKESVEPSGFVSKQIEENLSTEEIEQSTFSAKNSSDEVNGKNTEEIVSGDVNIQITPSVTPLIDVTTQRSITEEEWYKILNSSPIDEDKYEEKVLDLFDELLGLNGDYETTTDNKQSKNNNTEAITTTIDPFKEIENDERHSIKENIKNSSIIIQKLIGNGKFNSKNISLVGDKSGSKEEIDDNEDVSKGTTETFLVNFDQDESYKSVEENGDGSFEDNTISSISHEEDSNETNNKKKSVVNIPKLKQPEEYLLKAYSTLKQKESKSLRVLNEQVSSLPNRDLTKTFDRTFLKAGEIDENIEICFVGNIGYQFLINTNVESPRYFDEFKKICVRSSEPILIVQQESSVVEFRFKLMGDMVIVNRVNVKVNGRNKIEGSFNRNLSDFDALIGSQIIIDELNLRNIEEDEATRLTLKLFDVNLTSEMYINGKLIAEIDENVENGITTIIISASVGVFCVFFFVIFVLTYQFCLKNKSRKMIYTLTHR